ncbi:hypothetical protein DI09_57p100 [Mitosporidium daphniae]|uniref:Uncharacterized protein n=1 Tax=Mitosporidium daphniae TaxID=1485682 RepID=A0A098VP69_9MICR|nr:uncharacterized protein DI09_57p100 [Mitosporidium daphniae]KGG50755.1 hypothetical protein DI09_57p100 [Mitosporidium daphniae]|eukprot:XP_013237182.1 uncharacterized protein DI09_57p100 [Mitosporidium daphniae]
MALQVASNYSSVISIPLVKRKLARFPDSVHAQFKIYVDLAKQPEAFTWMMRKYLFVQHTGACEDAIAIMTRNLYTLFCIEFQGYTDQE